MKVGIITFQRVNNYGAILQSYALQKVIRGFGIECETIDYQRENVKDVLTWLKNKNLSLLTGRPDKQLYPYFEFAKVMILEIFLNHLAADKFDVFRKNIKYSRTVDKYNIAELNTEYDLFISGSDQVWNCGRVNLDSTYMLDFVEDPGKKGSYAASFGIDEIPQKYYDIYKKVLQNYKYLSVREASGISLLKSLTGKTPSLVLDPTLLLDKDEWETVASINANKCPYILVYQLGYSKVLLKIAKKISEKTGYEILVLPHAFGSNIKAKWCLGKGPSEWISLFMNAQYIVTNSFHGTAFSIIFEKSFLVDTASRSSMHSRIENILSVTGLQDRLIANGENDHIYDDIDYNKVNSQLKKYRDESMDYLKNMLGVNLENNR